MGKGVRKGARERIGKRGCEGEQKTKKRESERYSVVAAEFVLETFGANDEEVAATNLHRPNCRVERVNLVWRKKREMR